MTDPLAYWSCGGEVIGRGGVALSLEDGWALLDLHRDEAWAAGAAADGRGQACASRLARQLVDAIEAAGRWRKAARPLTHLR